jgi:predicted polyphosphate/ATP-dependent NAD kinase
MVRIGFLINPIAGMGGRVGLKGTDGVAAMAAGLGAVPISQERASEMLRMLQRQLAHDPAAPPIHWLTCSGQMGLDALRGAGFADVEQTIETRVPPAAADTREAAQRFVDCGVDLILFCGGDGTARDICGVTAQRVPVLGIPSGVKMYSGVFGVNPAKTADILLRFIKQDIGLATVEILDLDEESYRNDQWVVRLFMTARTPAEPNYLQVAKKIIAEPDGAAKHEIAMQLRDQFAVDRPTLVLLGPGSTLQEIGHALGLEKTLLGIDAVVAGRMIGKDLNERQILDLLARHPGCKLVLSPIGAQGFVLGRGNQQLSPQVVRAVGLDNIIVVATPAKLAQTPVLRFDTGDSTLDREIISRKFIPVIIGQDRTRMVQLAE